MVRQLLRCRSGGRSSTAGPDCASSLADAARPVNRPGGWGPRGPGLRGYHLVVPPAVPGSSLEVPLDAPTRGGRPSRRAGQDLRLRAPELMVAEPHGASGLDGTGTQPGPGRVRARLAELGLRLHGPHPPHDPLDAVVVHAGVARTSGQLPRVDGVLTCCGALGSTVRVDEGAAAAAVCALNALAVLEVALGTLDRVERVLTVTGYVASTPDFHRQPDVVDGASSVLYRVFGEAGRHTRSAIGVAALPRGGAVEIEVTVAVRD